MLWHHSCELHPGWGCRCSRYITLLAILVVG
jgi:hypothetical protein